MRITGRTVRLGAERMAASPIKSRTVAAATCWHAGSSTYKRGYLLASLRAGVIALVLLTFLVALILM